jgi:hypothetical protein
MKLVASMPVRNELGRYLRSTVTAALSYCDELVAVDDGSSDGTFEYLEDLERVTVARASEAGWSSGGSEHSTRQQLFELTLAAEPTHVLAIDADELVSDGQRLRSVLERDRAATVWTLRVVELWRQEPAAIRVDGGWAPRSAPILYRAPQALGRGWQIADRRCACPREPIAVSRSHERRRTGIDLIHMGWMDKSARAARTARYLEHDRGEHHARAHLESILWPDARVELRDYAVKLRDSLAGAPAPACR